MSSSAARRRQEECDGSVDQSGRQGRAGDGRLERARSAFRAGAVTGGRESRAREPARRAAQGAARGNRGGRWRGARGVARRHGRPEHQGGRRACGDGSRDDRHPREQFRRVDDAQARRRDARGFRVRVRHQHAGRILRRAGSREADDDAQQRQRETAVPDHQHRVGRRAARVSADRPVCDEQGGGRAHDACDGTRVGPPRHQRQRDLSGLHRHGNQSLPVGNRAGPEAAIDVAAPARRQAAGSRRVVVAARGRRVAVHQRLDHLGGRRLRPRLTGDLEQED
ncbi:putative 3-oxoacyl-[acyl-carrier protein] reductase [Burkholderia multivorans]